MIIGAFTLFASALVLAAGIFGGLDASILKVLEAFGCSTLASLASISASQTHMQDMGLLYA